MSHAETFSDGPEASAPLATGMIERRDLAFFCWALAINLALDVALLAAKAALDVADPPRRGANNAYLYVGSEGFLLGCFFAQLVAVAVWTALFDGSNLFRLLVGTLVIIGATFSLTLVGNAAGLEGVFLRTRPGVLRLWEMFSTGLFGLLVFYLVQAPLWMLRGLMQLHLTRQAEAPRPPRQLSLLHLLAIMAFLAVPMALARADISIAGVRSVGLVVLYISLASVVFGIGALVVLLGMSRVMWGIVAFAIMTEALVYAGSHLFMQVATIARPADWPFVVAAFRGVQMAVLMVGIRHALAVRKAGYRLVATMPRWRAAR